MLKKDSEMLTDLKIPFKIFVLDEFHLWNSEMEFVSLFI